MSKSMATGIGIDSRSIRTIWLALFMLVALWSSAKGQMVYSGPRERVYSQSQLDTVSCVTQTQGTGALVIDASLSFIRGWDWGSPALLTFWTSPWGLTWFGSNELDGSKPMAADQFQAQSYLYYNPPKSSWGNYYDTLPIMWKGVKTRDELSFHLNKGHSGTTCGIENPPSFYCKLYYRADAHIANLYQIDVTKNPMGVETARFLGFTHVERMNGSNPPSDADRLYAIGISYSDDNGKTWKYAGDAIRPKYDVIGDKEGETTNTFYSNIGGIPYVIVKEGGIDYFYVYFNEYVDRFSRFYPSVAKVKVADAIHQAETGVIDISKWRKLGSSGSWDQPSLTGTGKPLVPFTQGDLNITHYDTHSDAAYCAPIKTYFMVSQKKEWEGVGPGAKFWNRLILMSSPDGITWRDNRVIDESYGTITANPADLVAPYNLLYSSFYSPDSSASNDFSTIGNNFIVHYVRQKKIIENDTAKYSLKGDLYKRSFKALPPVATVLPLTTLFSPLFQ